MTKDRDAVKAVVDMIVINSTKFDCGKTMISIIDKNIMLMILADFIGTK